MSAHAEALVPPPIVNAGARLDRLPISRFHWRVLWLISAGAFLDAFDIYLTGGVIAAMLKDGFSTLAQNASFVSATFTGMLIGAGLAGWVGDRMGRRYSYQTNLALFGVASLAAGFAPTIYWLIGLRFLMGIGMGAELVVAAGTLCEFVPPRYRGRWILMMGMVVNSGLLAATITGYFVIPDLGWRAMFAIAGVGALIVWVLRKRMPESPRWLESVGRLDEDAGCGVGDGGRILADHQHLRSGHDRPVCVCAGTVSDRTAAARDRHRRDVRAGRIDQHALSGGDAVRAVRSARRFADGVGHPAVPDRGDPGTAGGNRSAVAGRRFRS
jgi:MFS family permease